jgi:hypothetical protein
VLAVGRLLLLLDEAQNIELLDLAIGEKAIHRVLLVAKKLKYRCQFRQNEQFYIALAEVQNFERSTRLFQGREADYQATQAGRIDIIHALEVQNDIDFPVVRQLANFLPEAGNGFANRQSALKIEDADPLVFALLYLESHTESGCRPILA